MNQKILFILASFTANEMVNAAPAPITSQGCGGGTASYCITAEAYVNIITDDNGYPNPTDQGLKVFSGEAGVNQIEIISSNRVNTIITTENGNNLAVTNSGTSIETSGGNKTEFLNTGVQLNNQKLRGVSDGLINDSSKEAVNGSQLFALKNDLQDEIETKAEQAKTEAINISNAYTNTAKTEAISISNAYTNTAKTEAINTSKAYTDAAKTEAISISNAYTNTAKTEAINTSKAYTDATRVEVLSISYAYTDAAKAAAIAHGEDYTDAAKAAAIAHGEDYTDAAKAAAIAHGEAYTDAAKAAAIAHGEAYTDVAKAEAITTSNIYTDNEIEKLSNKVVHYDVNEDGSINKNSITLAGGEGRTKISNLSAGNISSNSSDAVNGAQLHITNQTLAEFIGAGASYDSATQSFSGPKFQVGGSTFYNVGHAVDALDTRIDDLSGQVNSLEDKVDEGLAMSAAMAGLFQPYNVGKFNVSIAGGGYGSQGAIALGSGFRFNENIAVKAAVAGIPSKGKATYNFGMNFEW